MAASTYFKLEFSAVLNFISFILLGVAAYFMRHAPFYVPLVLIFLAVLNLCCLLWIVWRGSFGSDLVFRLSWIVAIFSLCILSFGPGYFFVAKGVVWLAYLVAAGGLLWFFRTRG